MEFNNNFPEWKNEGVAPPETLRTSGFKGGDKPPAAWLNWLTSLVGKCIKELQEMLRSHEHTLDDVSETAERKMSYLVAATSSDGISYTVTVDGVNELYDGLEITVIPNTASAQPAITLNVNGLGAKNVRTKINGYNSANSGTIAAFDKWFGEGAPITLRYVAKFDNWQTVDFSRPSASGLYGTIKEEQGGTGKTSLSEVLVGRAWHLAPSDCSNKDFNTLKTAGYYFGYTGMTNAKITNEISVLEVVPYSNDWVLQRQTRLVDGRTFFRHLRNGDTWSEWDEVCTSKQNVVAPLVYVSAEWISSANNYLANYLIIKADGTKDTSNLPYAELPFAPSAILEIKNNYSMWGGSLTKGNYARGWYLSGNKIYMYKTLRTSKSDGTYTDSAVDTTNCFSNSEYIIAFR